MDEDQFVEQMVHRLHSTDDALAMTGALLVAIKDTEALDCELGDAELKPQLVVTASFFPGESFLVTVEKLPAATGG